jgi:hypothetical protein
MIFVWLSVSSDGTLRYNGTSVVHNEPSPMPTPFTHLEVANRLLCDPLIPEEIRTAFRTYEPAFLLGSICADAKVFGKDREDTHFYSYIRPITAHPWRVMMEKNPALMHPFNEEHRVFIAAYVAHLAADEHWSLHMLKPHFGDAEWGNNIRWRFFVLNLLMITIDERDLRTLTAEQAQVMKRCEPQTWLPFIPDQTLVEWRDFVADQIPDDSRTLEVLGERVGKTPEELRFLVDSPAKMTSHLWNHVPKAALAQIETEMYAFTRSQLMIFWEETKDLRDIIES